MYGLKKPIYSLLVMSWKKLLLFLLLVLVPCVSFFSYTRATLIDMRDILHTRYKENENKWSLKEFPKWIVEGNLYEKAYSMAQLQVAEPALKALDLTYNLIKDRCWWENIQARDITAVFSRSNFWKQFRMMLDARDMTSSVQDGAFIPSCMAVYTCYNKEELEAKWAILKDLKYSDEAFWSCSNTVEGIFNVMYQRTTVLDTMKTINYWDDFLYNAKAEDGPFDLLLDVQAIGDILFTQNDWPSQVSFYDSKPTSSYVNNDPKALSWFSSLDPSTQKRLDRLPVTNSIAPSVPEKTTGTFPQNTKWPIAKEGSKTEQLKPQESPLLAQNLEEAGTPQLQNQLCEPLPTPEKKQPDMLDLAEKENEQTNTYNKEIDLNEQVALLLWSTISAEEEEKIWILPRWKPSGDTWPTEPPVSDEAKDIVQEILDLPWDSLEAMKKKIMSCVEQFTDENPQAWWKILWKSMTQPTEFTQCVLWNLCQEMGDQSWRGIYSIRICKELQKPWWLVRQQSIKSVEEVIDEMNNVCTTLRQSGALLEHNKTKDHMEDKMMRIKFADKFSFGVSVFFKWARDKKDPAVERQLAAQERSYLEEAHLGITDDLTFVDERNRYLILQPSGSAWSRNWLAVATTVGQTNQFRFEQVAKFSDALQTIWTAWLTANPIAKTYQLDANATTIDNVATFIEDNISLRATANQMTDSMNKKREAALSLYQASPN
jgi:hypothetical protein